MVYKLKAKYGGIDPSDAKRLKQLEDENAKLRRLLADAMLDNVVLKDLRGKPDNADATAGRSAACDAGSSGLFALRLRPDRCRSEDRAARQAARQPEIREEMHKSAEKRRRFGYRRVGIMTCH